jgi:cytochrome c peroxidase
MSDFKYHLGKNRRSFILGLLGIIGVSAGLVFAADSERLDQNNGIQDPEKLVPPIGPPAIINDWERDYPQYQPIGDGDTVEAPDAKPGTPNPPDIHKFGGSAPSSFVFDLSPDEPLKQVIERERKQRPKIQQQQQSLLEERYDLTPRFEEGQIMTRGKPIPVGPTAILKNGLTFEELAERTPEEIKNEELFPYLPLPHPLHSTGGMVFPKMMTDIHPERERYDVVFDIPEHFLPEFPPPLFLTSRPDLGDVSQGQEITNENFYNLLNGILPPIQLDGVRLLVEKIPQQQFNATDDRKTIAASLGVSCFDCHVNGHTNAAIHLDPNTRPQFSRFRIETPTLRGVNIQEVFGSKRALASVEDFTEFENRSAYFDHDLATAEKKGRRDLTRSEVMKMAQFQKLIDFPPAPKLTVYGELDPQKSTEQELRGENLFYGKAQCVACHTPPYFTDNLMHDLKVERFYEGRAEGSFKTFPLRGIKDSPPYLHDGRLLTLEDTVEFFVLITSVKLTKEEKEDLTAFLRAL